MEFIDGNSSLVTEFILSGFSTHPELQIILFLTFLILYCMILMANIGLMVLIRIDPHLQTPMYFFLSNLSFVDLCYSSAIVPKMLVNFLSENKSISYYGCALSFTSSVLSQIRNPLSWLPWHTIAMSPFVTLYCTRLWCLGESAYGWLSCHTLEATWVPWFTQSLRLSSNIVTKMSLIISSVTSLPCLNYLAQIHQLMSGSSLRMAARWKLSVSLSSSPPMLSFFTQSSRFALPVEGRSPSLHVRLTWFLWPSIRGLFCSFTHGLVTYIHPILINLSQCSTLLSSQYWTHWFIVCETKM